MQSKCLELEEKRRKVKGKRMQSNCLKLEERRRVGGSRMQSSCLELEEETRRVDGQEAEQLLRVK